MDRFKKELHPLNTNIPKRSSGSCLNVANSNTGLISLVGKSKEDYLYLVKAISNELNILCNAILRIGV